MIVIYNYMNSKFNLKQKIKLFFSITFSSVMIFAMLFSFGITLTSCFYDADNQKSISKEMPGAVIYKLNNGGGKDAYVVISQDSLVYYVSCNHATDSEISSKQLLFSIKKK